ncbi:MAG: hypothetical protein WC639_04680 [Patescibacteria group bacterium]|jgi:hypothetical protein
MAITLKDEYKVHLRSSKEHPQQDLLINSTKKRLIAKAGRRFGKTVGAAKKAVKAFLKGKRVLYAAPTIQQVDAFWFEVCKALREPIEAGVYKKNESDHSITLSGTKQSIKAKTAWNADTLRGDFADLLILDEFQLMAEDAWNEVGAPMLLDNNGDAVFIFTPPSLLSQGTSKARDPRHASKMFKKALEDTTGLWEAIHGSSHDNPFISQEALTIITQDMSLDAYRREIMAEDDEIETSWLVYSKFNERICKINRFPIPANWLIYSGHDFGSANPAALFIAQDPGTGNFYCYKEYAPGGGLSAAQHVDNFKEFTKGYNVIKRVGGNQTTEEEIRQAYTAHGWPIIAPKLAKVNAQLDRVIGLMELNKLFIFSDMTGLLTMIANCMWELDQDNKPTNKVKDEARFHYLAALRYIGSDFTPETVKSGTSSRVNYVENTSRVSYRR